MKQPQNKPETANGAKPVLGVVLPPEETPKEAAERLFFHCYPSWYDNGQFMKKVVAKDYCKKIANAIIKETLDEYTNDENHVRVEFWKQVLIEVDAL
jgi:hypothetical protein